MTTLLERIHHFGYAAAIVSSVAIICYFFAPHHEPAPTTGTVATQSTAQKLETEIASVAKAVDTVAQARANVVPILAQPAASIIHVPGLNQAEIAQILEGIGRQRTVPAYTVTLQAPTPMPTSSPPIGISSDQAAFLYQTAYNADAAALKNTPVDLHVGQEVVPPSRVKSVFALDRSMGVGYALSRRGALDLDVGATQGPNGLEPFAGVEARVKGTSVGALAGVTYRDHHAGVFVAIPVSLP